MDENKKPVPEEDDVITPEEEVEAMHEDLKEGLQEAGENVEKDA